MKTKNHRFSCSVTFIEGGKYYGQTNAESREAAIAKMKKRFAARNVAAIEAQRTYSASR